MKKIRANDIAEYVFPENLQYSPDGTYFAFQTAKSKADLSGYTRSVWLGNRDGVRQLTFTVDASLVTWDDEEHLIIARRSADTEPGTTDLYRLSLNGGEAQPWITLPFRLRTLIRLSEGLYVSAGEIDANDPDAYLDDRETREKKREAKKKEADYTVVDEIPYWHNGSNYTNKKRTALFRLETGGNLKIKRLTSPYTNVMTVINDGLCVYYTDETHQSKEDRMTCIHAYHADTKKTETIIKGGKYSFSGLFVTDGELYGLANDMKTYGLNQSPHIARITKNSVQMLCKPDRSFGNHVTTDVLLGGGKSAAVSGDQWITLVTDGDRTCIWQFDKDMRHTVLYEESGCIPFLDVSDEEIAFCRVTAGHPAEIFVLDRNSGETRCVSSFNDAALKDRYIALPERIDYVSEGTDLWGWVLLPGKFDPKKKYPAVLDVHGGPRGTYGEAFYHEMQLWASEGYVVFFTNIRGSDGRGDEFADIRGKYGEIDFKNLMDFTDAVLEAYPNIDRKRVCATGGSYGGFMMNWFEGHTDRFCALASQRSIASWISLTFTADIGPWFDPGECGVGIDDDLLAEESFRKLWQFSPLRYAEGARTPMLFIHSDEDRRCPLSEGMQMMQALTAQDVETRMVIFKGEDHGLSRGGMPKHRIRRLEEITGWFDRHTGKQTGGK